MIEGQQAVVEGLLKQCFGVKALARSVTRDPLLPAMADESGETRCERLVLSDGSKVYLMSVWETMNFSIVVFDGVQAWSRSVASKEVVNIARVWNIDVGDFMRSARARLCGQHPTSIYSMSPADKDAVNLAFTIDDLCEGEALDFQLRLDGISDVMLMVCEILDHLLDTNDKLKVQLTEAKTQFQTQKMLPEIAPKPEPPSITLTLSRSNPNHQPRRQTSSPFIEPRLLFSPSRDTPSTPRQQAHNQHLLRDTLENSIKSTSQPPSTSFNSSITKPTNTSTPLQTDNSREPPGNKSPVKSGYCMGMPRSNFLNDLTVNMVALTPEILRVLNSLSNGLQGLERESNIVEKPELDSGLKIAEMRSPGRETAACAEVENANKKCEGMIWSNCGFSAGMKKRDPEENCYGGNGHVVLEKSGSNGEGKESGGCDEERTTGLKVTLEDSGFRASAGVPESARGLKGKSSTEEKREKGHFSDQTQFVTPNSQQPRSNNSGRRQESRAETATGKRSFVTRESQFWEINSNSNNCSMGGNIDGIGDGLAVRTRSGSKREKKLQVSYAETEDEPEDGRKKKSTCSRSRSAGGQRSGRERTIQERLDELLRSHKHGKLEVASSDNDGTEGTTSTRETPTKRITRKSFSIDKKIKQEAMSPDEYLEYNKMTRDPESDRERSRERGRESERFQKMVPATAADGAPSKSRPRTISDLLQGKKRGNDNNGDDRRKGSLKTRRNGKRAASAPGGEISSKKQRCSAGGSSDRETSGSRDRVVTVETSVPDPDFYDFDKDRTEHAIEAHQVWAVYDEKDAMPRTYARINRISISPKFSALVSWLKPRHLSEQAKLWSEINSIAPACGEFECADNETTLTEINCFSHKMACTLISPTVEKIFPKKGEVWALYKNMQNLNGPTTAPFSDDDDDDDDDYKTTPKPEFHVAEIYEDVEAGEEPEIEVLGRVPGFRTVWRACFELGKLPVTDLSCFSHRVPAHKLEGNEVPTALRGSWDIDPAGLPLADSCGGI